MCRQRRAPVFCVENTQSPGRAAAHHGLFADVWNLLFPFYAALLYNVATYDDKLRELSRHGGDIMTRTAAREIAVHFAFELGFTGQTAEELLAEAGK